MTRKEISLAEFGMRVNALMTDSIPVMCFFVSNWGFKAKLYGFIDSLTLGDGLTISSEQGVPSASSRIEIPIGMDCGFFFGTSEDLPKDRREGLEMEYGNTVLMVSIPEDASIPTKGGLLHIFFTE
jgi:hypothetical protein